MPGRGTPSPEKVFGDSGQRSFHHLMWHLLARAPTNGHGALRLAIRLAISLAAALAMAGCNSFDEDGFGTLVSVYATGGDVQAVARGNFGAVPIELVREGYFEIVSGTCSLAMGITQVKTASGKVGWISVRHLSERLRTTQCAVAQVVFAGEVVLPPTPALLPRPGSAQ